MSRIARQTAVTPRKMPPASPAPLTAKEIEHDFALIRAAVRKSAKEAAALNVASTKRNAADAGIVASKAPSKKHHAAEGEIVQPGTSFKHPSIEASERSVSPAEVIQPADSFVEDATIIKQATALLLAARNASCSPSPELPKQTSPRPAVVSAPAPPIAAELVGVPAPIPTPAPATGQTRAPVTTDTPAPSTRIRKDNLRIAVIKGTTTRVDSSASVAANIVQRLPRSVRKMRQVTVYKATGIEVPNGANPPEADVQSMSQQQAYRLRKRLAAAAQTNA